MNVQARAGCTLELHGLPGCIHTERFCSRCRGPGTHFHLPAGSGSQSDGTSWGEGGRSKLHMETVTLATLLKLIAAARTKVDALKS